MSDTTSELLKAFVEASEDRKAVALQVLRGEVTTCPHLRQGRTVIGDGGTRVEAPPLLLRIGAAAELLGVSRCTLWRLCREGRIPRVEIRHDSFRVRRADLETFVAKDFAGPSGSPRWRSRRKACQAAIQAVEAS